MHRCWADCRPTMDLRDNPNCLRVVITDTLYLVGLITYPTWPTAYTIMTFSHARQRIMDENSRILLIRGCLGICKCNITLLLDKII